MHRTLLALALASLAYAQNKPPASAVLFKDIVACLEAANCRNMTVARMSVWNDVGPGMGMVFSDGGWKYELAVSRRIGGHLPDLEIMTWAPGETGPGQLIIVNSDGKVVSASLARLPSEPAVNLSRAPGALEAEWKRRKAFVAEPRWSQGGTLGDEFRGFWQKQADQALAVIRRQLATGLVQAKPAAPLADIVACVKASACKNAKPSTMSWADMGGIAVQVFTDGQSTYALALSRDDSLNIWVTNGAEQRAGRLIILGSHGRVTDAELGRQPGESFPMRMTPEQRAQWRELRKAYSTGNPSIAGLGPVGEKYKTYWQEQADTALAAIRRQLAK